MSHFRLSLPRCDWCGDFLYYRSHAFVCFTPVCLRCLYRDPAWSGVLVRVQWESQTRAALDLEA